jgi:hypothetical protein
MAAAAMAEAEPGRAPSVDKGATNFDNERVRPPAAPRGGGMQTEARDSIQAPKYTHL